MANKMSVIEAQEAIADIMAVSAAAKLMRAGSVGLKFSGTGVGFLGNLLGKGLILAGDTVVTGGQLTCAGADTAKGYLHDKAGDLRKKADEYEAAVEAVSPVLDEYKAVIRQNGVPETEAYAAV